MATDASKLLHLLV